MADERLNEAPLFLALTRPAMFMGVPMEAFAIACGVGGLAMIAADSILYLLLTPPILVVARIIAAKDQNAFRILFKWLDTSGRCRNRSFWGGTTCSPLRLRRRYTVEEID